MAIGLSHVKKTKRPTIATEQIAREASAKPWQSFEGLGLKTRTIQANEALRKLKSGKKDADVLSFNLFKDKNRPDVEKNNSINLYKTINVPCDSRGIFGFLRRLFFS